MDWFARLGWVKFGRSKRGCARYARGLLDEELRTGVESLDLPTKTSAPRCWTPETAWRAPLWSSRMRGS
eukprot:g22701.t1